MDADLVIVGGPTHAHGMSRPQTRQAAVTKPAQYGGGAAPEPGADGIGLREWFDGLPQMSGPAAAFLIVLLLPESVRFLVAKGGGLKPGEADRAEQWGATLARAEMGRSAGETRRQSTE